MKLPSFLYSVDRFWLHVPVGLVLVFLAWLSWVLCIVYAALFLAYELNEDVWTKDNAWKDLAGPMAGVILGSVIWTLIKAVT